MSTEEQIQFQGQAVDFQLWRSCLNCKNWSSQREICLKYNTKPPLRVIVLSCPDWQPHVPF